MAVEKSSFEISWICRPVPIFAPAITTLQKNVKDAYQAISYIPYLRSGPIIQERAQQASHQS
jgi:hypothetical protein